MVQSPFHDLMICKVSRSWYDVVKGEYFSAGTNSTNFWTVNKEPLPPQLSNFVPGHMVLYVLEHDKHLYVVGGGFFLSWLYLKPKDLWDSLGVRNGAPSYEAFIKEIKAQGGDEQSILTSGVLSGTFIFTSHDCPQIPDECLEDFEQRPTRSLMSLNEPIGKYIEKIVQATRQPELETYGIHWPGIYYVASHRNSRTYIAGFYARVMTAYNFKCAISGTQTRPVLEVAHIQPFYDHSFQSAQNGIVLRCDFNKLFSLGYLTLEYKKSDEIVVHVSDKLTSVWGEDYLGYEGKPLSLPENPEFWPKKEYIEWHQKNCFEHWLRVGSSANI